MVKINRHIEIVSSTSLELSSMSQKSRAALLAVLSRHYSRVGITIVNDVSDLEALVSAKPDLVFLGMKFVPSSPALGFQDPDKIWVSQYLDDHDIAYTGSSHDAHRLEFNKPLAKQQVLARGLRTSPYYVAKQHHPLFERDISLRFPLFIKPTDRGGGMGVDSDSVAHDFKQLQAKVRSITATINSDSLVEQYLAGREISVAILKREHAAGYYLMPIERIVPADEYGVRILSPKVKHADAGLSVAVTDEDVKAKVTALALGAFRALGARDYGRIDIRLDESGLPHFLEANLLPSLIDGYGNFPKACALHGELSYEAMILSIVNLALGRSVTAPEESLPYPATPVLAT